MTTMTQRASLPELSSSTTAEDCLTQLNRAERALRRYAAEEYVALTQYLFATARAEKPGLEPAELTLDFLEHRNRGRLLRQAVTVLAPVKGVSPAQLRAHLVDAINLHQHSPALLAKLHRGEVSTTKVRTAAAKLRALRLPDQTHKPDGTSWQPRELDAATRSIREAKTGLGAALSDLASEDLSDADFGARAAGQLEQHHPENAAERHAKAITRRRVRISACADGMGKLELYASASKVLQIGEVLSGITKHLSAQAQSATDDYSTVTSEAAHRTRTQLEADVLTDLLLDPHGSQPSASNGTRTGKGHTAPVTHIMTSLTEFLQLGGRASDEFLDLLRRHYPQLLPLAEDNNGKHTDPAAVRHGEDLHESTSVPIPPPARVIGAALQPHAAGLAALILQSRILKLIITDPVSGYPIGLGGSYRPPPAVRELVIVRDQHCRFPGCRVPARDCEVDHVQPFAESGQTAYSNLMLLCPEHHRAKTAGWWEAVPRPDHGDGLVEIRDTGTGTSKYSQPELPLDPKAWRAHLRQQDEANAPPF